METQQQVMDRIMAQNGYMLGGPYGRVLEGPFGRMFTTGFPRGGQNQPMQNSPTGPNVFNDPFGTAMSGNQSGTLQPFVNRNTSMANNALYGGLLGYQPQQLKAGNAGGTPVNPQAPQYSMPSAFPQGLLNFGNRSWMGGQ